MYKQYKQMKEKQT